jgi:Tfp pilus assembly PilM family ATPase
MKKIDKEKFGYFIDRLKAKTGIIKKYNYNIDEVIGVKDKERYILFVDKKLIRIYRGHLKSSPLLATYIPIENAIFYSFTVEKNVIEKIDLKSYIETRVYEEAGLEDTEEYVIKYEIVEEYKDDKYVVIETIIVPVTFIKENYKNILKETGYIDYISFPAFSYRALYEEGILQKANDVFAVLLHDKIFLTFYSEGKLVYISTISGGLNKIYDALSSLKIKNFDMELFKKLLTKKGLSIAKYTSNELVVLEIIKKEISNIINVIKEQIQKVCNDYDMDNFERLFITSEYGKIEGINDYIINEHEINIEAYGFEFYEKYNLDRLPVDPFLFLGMLEAHYAYKKNDQSFNYSLFLRKPTFFYRPSGGLVLSFIIFLILFNIYPAYLFIEGKSYEIKNRELKSKIDSLVNTKISLQTQMLKLQKEEKRLESKIDSYKEKVERIQNFIKSVYKFKFSYIPKSQELVDITYLLNKNHVFTKIITYKNHIYKLDVFSYHESDIPNLIKQLSDNGYSVNFKKIQYKNGKYISQIRIKE